MQYSCAHPSLPVWTKVLENRLWEWFLLIAHGVCPTLESHSKFPLNECRIKWLNILTNVLLCVHSGCYPIALRVMSTGLYLLGNNLDNWIKWFFLQRFFFVFVWAKTIINRWERQPQHFSAAYNWNWLIQWSQRPGDELAGVGLALIWSHSHLFWRLPRIFPRNDHLGEDGAAHQTAQKY